MKAKYTDIVNVNVIGKAENPINVISKWQKGGIWWRNIV